MKYFLFPRGKLLALDSSCPKGSSNLHFCINELTKKAPESLTQEERLYIVSMVRNGIEMAQRATIWAFLIPSVADVDLRSSYNKFLLKTSVYEAQIIRDLPRTFPHHQYFSKLNGEGQESLFKVVKAYSLFDNEVGYCQGISFIAGILLLFFPPSDAFALLVRIMHHYSLRNNYLPGMDGLHQRLYQFDSLLRKHIPLLYKRLKEKGTYSMMYASQWFLTIFTYKFPFEFALLIFDNYFLEGQPFLFKVGIALLKRNESFLEMLEFDELLEFLTMKLYYVYIDNPIDLIQDASKIEVTKEELDLLLAEYHRNELLDSLDGFKASSLLEENENLKIIIGCLEEEINFLQLEQKT